MKKKLEVIIDCFKSLEIMRTVCIWHVSAALFVLCVAIWVGVFKLAFYARDLLEGLLCR